MPPCNSHEPANCDAPLVALDVAPEESTTRPGPLTTILLVVDPDPVLALRKVELMVKTSPELTVLTLTTVPEAVGTEGELLPEKPAVPVPCSVEPFWRVRPMTVVPVPPLFPTLTPLI